MNGSRMATAATRIHRKPGRRSPRLAGSAGACRLRSPWRRQSRNQGGASPSWRSRRAITSGCNNFFGIKARLTSMVRDRGLQAVPDAGRPTPKVPHPKKRTSRDSSRSRRNLLIAHAGLLATVRRYQPFIDSRRPISGVSAFKGSDVLKALTRVADEHLCGYATLPTYRRRAHGVDQGLSPRATTTFCPRQIRSL
jgi:hypothetical protein